MAYQFPTSISKTDSTLAVDLGTTDDVIVAAGILVASNYRAISGTGIGHEVRVAGSVFGGTFGVDLRGASASVNNYDVRVDKSGFVFSGNGSAVVLYGVGNKLVNAGEIDSNYFGVYMNASATGTTNISNSGIIRGDNTAIARNSGGNFGINLVNTGLIEGANALGDENSTAVAGKDTITNTGKIIGNIMFAGGDDIYTGTNGRFTGTVFGGAGNDTARGGIDNDKFNGGDNNDKLFGGNGNDTLNGDAGIDFLQGDIGNDILNGGTGIDTLYGGLGKDALTGGADKDTFVFKSIKDSTVASSGRDLIKDFNQSQADKIDLKAIDASTKAGGDQAFKFIGTNDFHKVAGELNYVKKSGDTFISGDVNGDGKADFMIALDTLVTLKATDFIL